MTREEREDAIKFFKEVAEREVGNAKYSCLAIEALEQEPMLDKIKDEIKGMYRVILKGTPKDDWAVKWNDCLDEVLRTIDKYKAESEE